MDRNVDRSYAEVRCRLCLLAIPLLFLALFYFYPLARIFSLSFSFGEAWSVDRLVRLIAKSYYLKIFWFTTWQALLSTLLSLAVALPGAYIFSRYQFPGKRFLKFLSTLPFVLPTIVVAAAFQALLGDRGLINLGLMKILQFDRPPIQINHSIWFVLIAHVFYNYSVVFRIVGGFWANLKDEMAEAAALLGASPREIFWKITLPVLKPAIIAASLLVFVLCFSSFGVVLLLGGAKYATIEVEIYRQAVHYFNLPTAAALSFIQIIFTFVLMSFYSGIQRKISIQFHPKLEAPQRVSQLGTVKKILVAAYAGFVSLFLGGPLIALLLRSFIQGGRFSLVYYYSLFANKTDSLFFVPPTYSIFYSVSFGLIALAFSITFGVLASSGLASGSGRLTSMLDPLFMLPLSTSAVTLGFGFIVALDKPPLNFRSSIFLVPIAHTLVALPFVIRSILPSMRSIPKSLPESAAVLGASPWQAWIYVDMPLIIRSLIVGAIFAFTISLGEFGATLFVARPDSPTIPLAIFRFLGQPGSLNYGRALAMSCILLLVTACGYLLLEKLRGKHIEEV